MKIKANARTVAGVHTHTSSILKENINKKQIELSFICVFLI